MNKLGDNNNGRKDIIKESNLTYDDYAAVDDGNRYELVKGQLELMSPAPTVTHQLVSFEMQKTIAQSCETDYIILNAPVDVILSQTDEVRQPDLVLIHRNRVNILSNRGVEGAPDLVVEILSPSSLKRDKIDKLKTYEHYKVPEYWTVEPISGILEEYILNEGRYELFNIFQGDEPVASPTIPCVSFTMANILDNIPEIKG
ncbi:Uma2 family endonuclease [Virgibacillus sp. FSP13]